MVDVQWVLLTVQLRRQDFDAAVATMQNLTEKFSMAFGDLSEIPEYAELIKSPQYATWLESRKAASE